MKLYHYAFLLAFVLGLGGAACGGKDDGRNPQLPPGDEEYDPPPVEQGSGTPPNATSQTCEGGSDDCDYWYCQCDDGFIVNSRNCTNDYCLNAQGACPGACEHFDHGAWTGQYGGGPQTPGEPGTGNSCGDFASSTCGTCQETYCCGEGAACGDSDDCLAYWDCAVACGGDGSCRSQCDDFYPAGRFTYEALESCLVSECTQACGF